MRPGNEGYLEYASYHSISICTTGRNIVGGKGCVTFVRVMATGYSRKIVALK